MRAFIGRTCICLYEIADRLAEVSPWILSCGVFLLRAANKLAEAVSPWILSCGVLSDESSEPLKLEK